MHKGTCPDSDTIWASRRHKVIKHGVEVIVHAVEVIVRGMEVMVHGTEVIVHGGWGSVASSSPCPNRHSPVVHSLAQWIGYSGWYGKVEVSSTMYYVYDFRFMYYDFCPLYYDFCPMFYDSCPNAKKVNA